MIPSRNGAAEMEQGRVWLAILLSLGLFLAYDYFVIRPYREVAKRQVGTSTLPPPRSEAPPLESPPAAAPAAAVGSGTPITVETDLFSATFDSLGGRLRHFELKRYRAHVGADSPGLSLIGSEALPVLPLTLEIGGRGTDAAVEYAPDKTALVLPGSASGTIALTGSLPDGGRIR